MEIESLVDCPFPSKREKEKDRPLDQQSYRNDCPSVCPPSPQPVNRAAVGERTGFLKNPTSMGLSLTKRMIMGDVAGFLHKSVA